MPAQTDRQKLISAAKKGNVQEASELLNAGVSVNTVDLQEQKAIIHYAVQNGSIGIVKKILSIPNANTSRRDKLENTAVHYAAIGGHLDIIKLLIEQNPNTLGFRNAMGKLPIHLACYYGHSSLVKLIISKDPSCVNALDEKRRSPLHLASFKGHVEVVKVLLSAPGTNASLTDKQMRTALHLAACKGHTAVVKHLIANPDCGRDITDADGKTPSDLAQAGPNAKQIQAVLNSTGSGSAAAENSVPMGMGTWEWEDGSKGSEQWKPFSPQHAELFERMYYENPAEPISISIMGSHYSISIVNMEQTNQNTGYKRRIRSHGPDGLPRGGDPEKDSFASASHSRILSFENSTDAVLSPIMGVFDDSKNPLIGVEEACQFMPFNLVAFLYQAGVFASKKKAVIDSVPGLTTDEARAIYMYSAESPLYPALNSALRVADRNVLKSQFFPYLRILLTGLQKLKDSQTKDSIVVNRGVKLDLTSKFPGEYVKGGKITWWQFSSCTKDVSVLENPMFLGTNGSRTIFQIHSRRGVEVSSFSAIPGEAEVILPPGTTLHIDGIAKFGANLTMISCRDVTGTEVPEMVS